MSFSWILSYSWTHADNADHTNNANWKEGSRKGSINFFFRKIKQKKKKLLVAKRVWIDFWRETKYISSIRWVPRSKRVRKTRLWKITCQFKCLSLLRTPRHLGKPLLLQSQELDLTNGNKFFFESCLGTWDVLAFQDFTV